LNKVGAILESYNPAEPGLSARALRNYWLEFEPNRGIELIKAEQRAAHEAIGIPIRNLKSIGDEAARTAQENVSGYIPLVQTLWEEFGREGRVIALIIAGAMELVEPQTIIPLLKGLCKSCYSWEDADRLAMDALEPIVRKKPDLWLGEIEHWLEDRNKWVRRAAVTVVGRLPMKHPAYVESCLKLAEPLLLDEDVDVKKAVSFAIRLCAKSNPGKAYEFMERQVPPENSGATWVLCDVIRSMDRKTLRELSALLERYQEWVALPNISNKDKRSIQSAIRSFQDMQS
jgi:3-methyladenine DNA glycosylase AlkD